MSRYSGSQGGKIEIQIEGFDELRAKIKKLGNEKDKVREVRAILMNIANSALNKARELSPVGDKYVKWGKKKYLRKDYIPGTGKKSLAKKVMTRARNPMVTISPRSRKSADGFYMRQFVIPGHNIYKSGFKRSRKGRRDGDLIKTRARNSSGAVKTTPKNYFLDRAYEATKNKTTKEAETKMATFMQKRIDRLSKI